MKSLPRPFRRHYLELLEARRVLATFTVNSASDFGSSNETTLRDAILQANELPGPDVINFAIPGAGPHTIQVGSAELGPLPPITEAVIIDGYTEPGAAANTNSIDAASNATLMIELDGTSASFSVGLYVDGASDVVIRGLAINRFLIGIYVEDGENNAVAGNYIGVGLNGATDLGNSNYGVEIAGGSGNTVGGLSPQSRNVISGNDTGGINLFQTSGATVQGNFLGVNAQGTVGVANGVGINIDGGGGHTIGGPSTSARNVIAQSDFGIVLGARFATQDATQDNDVFGNFIGADRLGNPLPNTTAGVLVEGSSNNRVGGVGVGEGNLIRIGGTTPGVVVRGDPDFYFPRPPGVNNPIRGNRIAGGTGLGIDLLALNGLAGRTANDPGDVDVGGNRLQNFPEFVGDALLTSGGLRVEFSVPSAPTASNYPLLIDYYLADASGNAGQIYLGTSTYAEMSAGGVVVFMLSLPSGSVQLGDRIVATATDEDGNTSEFSAALVVTNPPLRVGNQVWSDTDNDGNFDDGESGIAGVTLNLLPFVDSNGNGTFDSGDALAPLLQTTTTAANGEYQFGDLLPGNYIVQVSLTNFIPGGALAGLGSSTGNNIGGVAPAPNNDQDNDDNGNPRAGVGVLSGVISLSLRGEPAGEDDNSNTNLTVDFGFAQSALVVDTQNDVANGDLSPGDVSLRELMMLANSNPAFNVIRFSADLPSRTINLGSALPVITRSLTIDAAPALGGPSAQVTINASAGIRVLTIDNGATPLIDVAINNLLLTGGNFLGDGGAIYNVENLIATNVAIIGNRAARGGGVFNGGGSLTIQASTISGNTANGNFRSGGGVFNDSGDVTIAFSTIAGNTTVGDGGGVLNNSGDVTITGAAISGNSVIGSGSDGGGIYNVGGNVLVESSTVSSNSASDSGGGVYHLDASRGATTINFSTITQNSARRGGGLAVNTALNVSPTASSANVVLGNSILAGNTGGDVSNVGSYLPSNAGRYVRSQGSNLIGTSNATGAFIAADLTGVADPGLGGLADYGGPTETHALLAGSPAIDAGGLSPLPTFDQRGPGFLRSVDGDDDQNQRSDIGAFEFGAGSFLVIGDGDASSWGDFDENGAVNGADLTSPGVGFRDRFGEDLTGSDFLTWQRNLGMTSAAAAGAAGSHLVSEAVESAEPVLNRRAQTADNRLSPLPVEAIDAALGLVAHLRLDAVGELPWRPPVQPQSWQNGGHARPPAPPQVSPVKWRAFASETSNVEARRRWHSTTINGDASEDAAWDRALQLAAIENATRDQRW